MTLTQLIAEQYDIDCNDQSQVQKVVDVLKRNKVKEYMGKGGTVIWLLKSNEYIVNDRLSIFDKTISATDFLKLNL
jgi:uncharacterized ubiquitin-like protein YukD